MSLTTIWGTLGLIGGLVGGFFTGGASWVVLPGAIGGLLVGGVVGAIGDKIITTNQKDLELKDKQASAEIAKAKSDEGRAELASKALDHNQNLFNKISEQLAKKNSRNEELKEIIEGNKPLPVNTTMAEVKKEYTTNQQESSELVRQLGNIRATMDNLTSIIQSGGKNWDWPLPTVSNVAWGISLLVLGLIFFGVVVRTLKKWLSMLL